MHDTCYTYLAHMVCVPHVSHSMAPDDPAQLKAGFIGSAWEPALHRGSLGRGVGRRSCPRADTAYSPEKPLVSSHSAAVPLRLLPESPFFHRLLLEAGVVRTAAREQRMAPRSL